MEYIFGTVQRYDGVEREILKTKDIEHTNLIGRQITERDFSDRHITETFEIQEKYFSAEDAEGNCYDWYYITNHNRDTDRYEPQKDKIQSQIDYIAMMADIELDGDNDGEVVLDE